MNAKDILQNIASPETKLGDLRKIAKEIKKDHDLATELWNSGNRNARMLSILIMDKKQLTEDVVEKLFEDMGSHDEDDRNQIADWLMANQLSKDKKTIAMMASWQKSKLALQRRIFWYYQARLRWMGKIPIDNASELLPSIEEDINNEVPEVQWAMNFTAGQIGVFDTAFRSRCIAIGENSGLYRDEIVPKNCTPNYLPEFIRIQAEKMGK